MENKLPIILIHQGDSHYLPATILQLRYTNSNSSIFLIGDKETLKYKHWVQHIMLAGFTEGSEKLASVYKHYSTNGYEFELICLQRWFILQEFMEQMKIEQCIYLDSDILVYSKLNELHNKMMNCGMTVVGISAHTNFISKLDVLKNFCQLIWQTYSSSNSREMLKGKYESFLKLHHAGGISDMTFFTEFREKYPGQVCDISEVLNGGVFDITFDNISDFESEDGHKRIYWKGGVPFGKHSKSEELIRFHTLHFQGGSKKAIQRFTTFSFWFALIEGLLRIQYWLTRITRKLL